MASQKGGVGRTSTSIALAVEWRARGRKVVVVDCDPQKSALTWAAVAAENGHAAPTVVAMAAGLSRPGQLPELASAYQVVIIDAPPRTDALVREILMVTDLAVLLSGQGPTDIWSIGESADLVQKGMSARPALKAAVLITRKQPRTTLGQGARAALTELGLPVFKTEITYRATVQQSLAVGQGPTTYAPKSPAADEVRALATEIERMARRGG